MTNSYCTYLTVVIFFSYLIFNGTISVAVFYLILGLVEQLTYPLTAISSAYQGIVANSSLNKKIVSAFEDEIKAISHSQELEKFINKIEIKNLKYSIGEKEIIKGLNLSIEKNKKYLVKGKSGTGKSTLLNIIYQNISNYDGEIIVDGKNYRTVSIKSLMAIMSDKPTFLDTTLLNNITLFEEIEENK